MSKTFILELSAVAVLVTYLRVSVWFRNREAWRQYREDLANAEMFRKQWQPTVLDASSISEQVERFRDDYVAAVHSRPHRGGYCSRLVGLVRDAMLRLSYFRNLKKETPVSSEHETEKGAA